MIIVRANVHVAIVPGNDFYQAMTFVQMCMWQSYQGMTFVQMCMWESYQSMTLYAAALTPKMRNFHFEFQTNFHVDLQSMQLNVWIYACAQNSCQKYCSKVFLHEFDLSICIFDESRLFLFQSYVKARKSPGFGNYHALIRQENRAALTHWLLTVG